jgi:hypothetical protein
MSPDGLITLIDVDTAGDYTARIVPTSLDSHGLPVIAADEALERISQRVIEWSAKLGTKVELHGSELRV